MAERKRNIYADTFTAAYERHYQMPYHLTTADMVQLDQITNKGPLAARMTLEVFQRGCQNYFASELGVHTLKHLCSAFVPYWRQPLDRFGKPRQVADKIGDAPKQIFASWHQKFLHAAFKATQGKPQTFDEIDKLFEQVADGLSEHEAYQRLKEIELRPTTPMECTVRDFNKATGERD